MFEFIGHAFGGFLRKESKWGAKKIVQEVEHTSLETAARSAEHPSVNQASRAAEKNALEAASRPEIAIVREANAANRIRAKYMGVATVLTPVLAAGGAGLTIWRAEQTARDMGAKGAEMAKDVLGALHNDMDAALQAIGSIPQGLTDGLNISGPVKTLIQAGSTAVMVGGAIFTVYGTYRLFK